MGARPVRPPRAGWGAGDACDAHEVEHRIHTQAAHRPTAVDVAVAHFALEEEEGAEDKAEEYRPREVGISKKLGIYELRFPWLQHRPRLGGDVRQVNAEFLQNRRLVLKALPEKRPGAEGPRAVFHGSPRALHRPRDGAGGRGHAGLRVEIETRIPLLLLLPAIGPRGPRSRAMMHAALDGSLRLHPWRLATLRHASAPKIDDGAEGWLLALLPGEIPLGRGRWAPVGVPLVWGLLPGELPPVVSGGVPHPSNRRLEKKGDFWGVSHRVRGGFPAGPTARHVGLRAPWDPVYR